MVDTSDLPSNRKFGLFFAIVFSVGCGYFVWKATFVWAIISGVIAATISCFALVYPSLLEPLNRGWMSIGRMLGVVISPVVLGVMFFGLITPIALFLKLIRRDALRIHKVSTTESFWRPRQLRADGQTTSFKDQY